MGRGRRRHGLSRFDLLLVLRMVCLIRVEAGLKLSRRRCKERSSLNCEQTAATRMRGKHKHALGASEYSSSESKGISGLLLRFLFGSLRNSKQFKEHQQRGHQRERMR